MRGDFVLRFLSIGCNWLFRLGCVVLRYWFCCLLKNLWGVGYVCVTLGWGVFLGFGIRLLIRYCRPVYLFYVAT